MICIINGAAQLGYNPRSVRTARTEVVILARVQNRRAVGIILVSALSWALGDV